MKNKKGFTLIELLAVIVILGVLLAIAIPAVAKYINSAKKSTYVDNVQSYVKAARQEVLVNNSTYALPIAQYDATIISFSKLASALDNGGKTSSYGGEFEDAYSYVVIVNEGEASNPQYVYYIAAIDNKGYGIGTSTKSGTTTTLATKAINYDSLKEENIIQFGNTTGFAKGTKDQVNGMKVTTRKSDGTYEEKDITVRYIY